MTGLEAGGCDSLLLLTDSPCATAPLQAAAAAGVPAMVNSLADTNRLVVWWTEN